MSLRSVVPVAANDPRLRAIGVVALIGLGLIVVSDARRHRRAAGASSLSSVAGRVGSRYGELPLAFEPNHGQTDRRVRFLAHGSGLALFVTENEAVLSLDRGNGKPSVVRTKLVAANPRPLIVPERRLQGRVNYLLGNDPSRWTVDIPSYARIVERGVYPGVDLAYYGREGRLEYDFLLQPGADPRVIALAFPGVRRLALDRRGNLRLAVRGRELRELRPVAYQLTAGGRRPVSARFRLAGGRVRFALGRYDRRRPLVIDPSLVYSTYLGGGGGNTVVEQGLSVAVDPAGSAYVTGRTASADFPTVGPVQAAFAGGADDVFVSKLSPTGTTLEYSTYLGGSSDEPAFGGEQGSFGLGIAVDSEGLAYVTGSTTSVDFPTTVNALQAACVATFGCEDAFVSKLSPSGDALRYSTYLGGSGPDFGDAIAIDSARNAYVTGSTSSCNPADFPLANPLQSTTSCADAFVSKLNASGSALVYSTYLGGPPVVLFKGATRAFGIAVDAEDAAYVTGSTAARLFPTVNALQAHCGTDVPGECGDAFVSKLSPSGTALVYSTYLGGTGSEVGYAIAVDSSESAYVTGETQGGDFPTFNPVQPTCGSIALRSYCDRDVFVSRLSPTGTSLVYSTYLGGSDDDTGYGIAVDSSGSAYVTGSTFGQGLFRAPDFPTANPLQTPGFSRDAFIAKLVPAGDTLAYSSHLGGCGDDEGRGIAVDSGGNAYVVGGTGSLNFPTVNALQPVRAGSQDAFVAMVGPAPAAPIVINCTSQQQIVVKKRTLPSGSSQRFSFLIGDDVHPEGIAPSFVLMDGQSQPFVVQPGGAYFVRETPTPGWDSSASCDDGSPVDRISVSSGETVTCTFTNTQRGAAAVTKTVKGAPPASGQSFTFELRDGASATAAGTTIEQRVANSANGGLIDFNSNLVAGKTYALCETVMPGWMTTLGPPFYVVYNPSGDNSTVCTDFSVQPGTRKASRSTTGRLRAGSRARSASGRTGPPARARRETRSRCSTRRSPRRTRPGS